jgi:YegS/Rv2252/BmrU family lipid kinase
MSEVTYCFIVNPAAGGGLAGRHWPVLREKLETAGVAYCHFDSEYSGHGRELARAAFESGERHFMAVGGDGTANEILNGLLEAAESSAAEFCLGSIPWGTGNDWARYYGFSSRADEVIQALQGKSCIRQDIGKASFTDGKGAPRNHYFLNCAGTGFDSYLLEQMTAALGSRFRYFVFLLKCLRKFRAVPLQVNMDCESIEEDILLLEICLGKFAGAGMRFAPSALVDDGLFDVLLINDLSRIELLSSLYYLYNGRINEHSAVNNWQCRSISISAGTGQYLHCDGELIGQLPVDIEILPGALSVLAPKDPLPTG